MKLEVYITNSKKDIDARAEYDSATNITVVKAGSKLSHCISEAPKFRGRTSIIKQRNRVLDANYILLEDVKFNSPSTAGNFVTGFSTNGFEIWRDSNGRKLKDVIM